MEIRSLLENGEITSEELCEVYIERINTYDKDGIKLNSVIFLNTSATEQAKILDAERKAGKTRGALHGIPILVKDNIDVAGFPTTLGKKSDVFEPKAEDAEAVKKLVDAGAIILGKTNLSTGDLNSRYTLSSIIGQTLNVFNTDYSSGGSSGGSAVSVAASFAAASLATDTNSSLISPASLNGVVAFRPTHDTVSYVGCENIVKARDTVGPVTKTVSDSALMMEVLTGQKDFVSSLKKDALKGKTVAILKELYTYTYNSPNEFKNTDKEIVVLFDKAVEDIKGAGANVVTISIPSIFKYATSCRESLSTSSSAKQNFLNDLNSELTKNNADIVIFPSYLSAPLTSKYDKSGKLIADSQNYLNCTGYLPSVLGLPAVTVPMGYHSSGVAAGIEMVGLKNTDKQLLSYAYSFEQLTAHSKLSDLVPNLYKESAPQNPPQIEDTVSEENELQNSTAAPTEKQKSESVWVMILSSIMLIAVCVWVLYFSIKTKGKKDGKTHRNF